MTTIEHAEHLAAEAAQVLFPNSEPKRRLAAIEIQIAMLKFASRLEKEFREDLAKLSEVIEA